MPCSGGVKPVQARLGDDERPFAMAAARRAGHAQNRFLNRVVDLHDDQQKMRAALAPGDILGRVVAGLAEAAGIEKAQQRRLRRQIVERCGARTGREPGGDFGAWIARKGGDDRCLARSRLPEQPHHRRHRLRADASLLFARSSLVGVAEECLADGFPQPLSHADHRGTAAGMRSAGILSLSPQKRRLVRHD